VNTSLLTEEDLALRPSGSERCPWLREALAAEPDGGAALPGPERDTDCDVAIIGGGYTGMWTAYFLTERHPDARIVLLEQDVCGGGPSGRNGGFVNAWWDELPTLIRLFGPDGALEAARASAASVHAIGEWCERHGVDAHYRRAGMLTVSTTPLHDRFWTEIVEACRSVGAEDAYRALTPEEVHARCAGSRFREGALMADGATIQPALLARGLRRVLLERGVTIHEGTRVRSLDRNGSGSVRLRTADVVELRAGQVVLAINAWASGWRPLHRSVLAWSSYMVRSEPIPERLAELGWTGGESIVDARFSVHYLRTTHDGRIALGAGGGRPGYGGRIGRSFTDDVSAARRAAYGFRLFFPGLADVRLTDAWGGPIDVSPTHVPHFGTLRDRRVHFGHGYSGNGVGPSHLGGQILAALTLGSDEPITRLAIVGRPRRQFPPEPFRYVGARVLREAMIRREDREELGRSAAWPIRMLTSLPRRLGYQLGPE
jgi:glycine/D-amino acid oxidase-like deaminating enzyme